MMTVTALDLAIYQPILLRLGLPGIPLYLYLYLYTFVFVTIFVSVFVSVTIEEVFLLEFKER